MEPTTTTGAPATDQSANATHARRRVAVVGVCVAALVVAATGGFAIGWKVQRDRAQDDIKNARPIGTVTAVDDESVTIRLTGQRGELHFVVTDATAISSATPSNARDVVEGARVLVRNTRGSSGDLEAVEIVVLPDD